jgi:hypothetical protein
VIETNAAHGNSLSLPPLRSMLTTSSASRASRFTLDLLDEDEHHLGEWSAEWVVLPPKDVPARLASCVNEREW